MLPRLSSGLLRLGLAVPALVGLAHASSTGDRPRATVVPSWITPLSLDGEGTLLDSEGREIASNTYGGEQFINFRIEALLRPGACPLRLT